MLHVVSLSTILGTVMMLKITTYPDYQYLMPYTLFTFLHNLAINLISAPINPIDIPTRFIAPSYP